MPTWVINTGTVCLQQLLLWGWRNKLRAVTASYVVLLLNAQGLICSAVTPWAQSCLCQCEALWWGHVFPMDRARAICLCFWTMRWHQRCGTPCCILPPDSMLVHVLAPSMWYTVCFQVQFCRVTHHPLCGGVHSCMLLLLSSVHILVKFRNESNWVIFCFLSALWPVLMNFVIYYERNLSTWGWFNKCSKEMLFWRKDF